MLGIIATVVSDSDREFILSIYKKFYPQMKYQILHVVGKCNNADDLIQDTVIRLIAHIELLQVLQENQIMMYAVKTAKSVALDYMRKNSVRGKWQYYPEEYEEIADKAVCPKMRISLIALGRLNYLNGIRIVINVPYKLLRLALQNFAQFSKSLRCHGFIMPNSMQSLIINSFILQKVI